MDLHNYVSTSANPNFSNWITSEPKLDVGTWVWKKSFLFTPETPKQTQKNILENELRNAPRPSSFGQEKKRRTLNVGCEKMDHRFNNTLARFLWPSKTFCTYLDFVNTLWIALFPLYSCLENNHRQGFQNEIIIMVFLRNCANEPFSRLICVIAQMESSQTKKTTNVCWGGVQHHDKTRKQEQQFHGINSPAPNWQRSCWLILKWFIARWNECSFYRKIGRWNESREGS